jgi:glutamyl-tRNA synthetase
MLHLGGARTALFNYLFARHHGGQFLLRIEDTDRERNSEAATEVIFDGLTWLGLEADERPLFQSTRQQRHAEVAYAMLAAGTAYRCWLTQDELKRMRDEAQAEGRSTRVESPWRDRNPAEGPPGINPAIRLRAPREGETVVDDLVQGFVRVANTELDDMVILRADGTPTYQHAVVVDDHDMGITHVIRGDDHLTNTFRQLGVYRAMGWTPPLFAHIPLIHGPDGTKLSKRHGAVSVLEFREQGFLPDALCNYLLRLGWAHGDAEILSRAQQIELFDTVGINRGAARMDYAKLLHLNGVYLRAADDAMLSSDMLARLQQRGLPAAPDAATRVLALVPHLKERAKTLVELADSAAFLVRTVPLPFEPKAAALLTPDAKDLLRGLAIALDASDFTLAGIDTALRSFAEAQGRKLGQVAQPLRAALTGSTASPPIDATAAALGRDEVRARIAAAAAE